MFVLRDIAILLAGLFIGFTFATMMLYTQLENRYRMGQNNGLLVGDCGLFAFLSAIFQLLTAQRRWRF